MKAESVIEIMYISNKQRAIINSAVKPFYITSNYLGPGLQNLLNYYSKYFTKRRFSIIHFLPTYKNSRNDYQLTIMYNAFFKQGGFAKKRRPITWTFYGNTLLTKYGRKKQNKDQKRKRKIARRLKRCKKQTTPTCQHQPQDDQQNIISVVESSSSNDSAIEPIQENCQTEKQNEPISTPAKQTVNEPVEDSVNKPADETEIAHPNEEVAALITESGTDDNQLSEIADVNGEVEESVDEGSISNETIKGSQDEQIESVNHEAQDKSAGDINEKIRQQLKLLKMGKSENFLFTTKESRSSTNIRSTNSAFRRTNSSLLDESKKTSGGASTDSNDKSRADDIAQVANSTNSMRASNDEGQKSKSNGGIIDSLFNKFQSINQNVSTRSKAKPLYLSAGAGSALVQPQPKRMRRSEEADVATVAENSLNTTIDSNQEDSNQSTNSVSMGFLGFDISNKNLNVSALLPTPRVVTSNDQAAFVSEYLDMFMKENSLEKSNDFVALKPKRRRPDEALMTTDAEPPNLSVPERPMDMQRPRTLAEKRQLLQQVNDISLLIIENESTVYHELKKRVKQGSAYDNTLMRSIRDADIPFRRDCWRAACWISTANNRFFYRTILDDDEEIKLAGSRGDNVKKIAFRMNSDDKKPQTSKHLKHILSECPQKCLSSPIDGIRINNLDLILGDNNINSEHSPQDAQKFGLLKRAKLCMFSREYLKPGSKCKKVNCKANRKSSFDLEYGSLELVKLPSVQLEVWPQVGLPLSDQIKPILKTIPINSNVITPEWAKFAVSVVRENPNQIKHRRKYKKPEVEKPQSVVFNIPYENDEKMILIRRRRRSAIVFDEKDTKYEHIEEFYKDVDDNQLTFAQNVDPDDQLSLDCASVLTNMIESIGIAVNDSNFIKRDPDIDYVGKVVPVSSSKESAKVVKSEKEKNISKAEKQAKSKLMKELKRLNVTVIDTANDIVKSKKSDEICQKLFCKLGCVCESIDSAKHIQTHCQLYDCMFSCKCINTPFNDSKPFYLDNSIDMLQAQANSRLAKEEKEFKSTIIVSENDMFVLPNSSTATKRSSKKQKRFTNDETCLEDTETETIFNSKRRRQAEKVVQHQPVENRRRNVLLKSLQHVRVEVEPLPELEVEPWCMVHCLYKCHCKGRAQKGRIFSFHNKKNDLTGPGGWELITPRKRQYTFERENAIEADEPIQKSRKLIPMPENKESTEQSSSSARTTIFNWKSRPRKSTTELKTLRNECMFVEDQRSDLLNQRIVMCRKYNQAQNMLTKTMENGRLGMSQTKSTIPNGSIQSTNKLTNASLQQLNHIITDTMHRLTALQERNALTLNPTPNKLSIVPWDRMLQAFKANEVYIWDVLLKDNLRLLILTTTFTKPRGDGYLKIININYADINSLPMVGKMLRNDFQSDRTKYLAMVLLRVTHFWRVCGVLHSDLKYMDDELRAKPTPEQNPLLGAKIDRLYKLLLRNSSQNSQSNTENPTIPSVHETKNGSPTASVSPIKASTKSPNNELVSPIKHDDADDEDDDDDVKMVKTTESATFFENASMRLSLPIPILQNQRLLMIDVGDDFTHVWFPTWHKFLSIKRIQNSFILAKRLSKAIEMSQSSRDPKVFVSHSPENRIFIGPYGNCDRQNLALFVKHNNHMMLSELYYKEFGSNFTKKTKASWIYSSTSHKGKLFKIGKVYSKHNMPAELALDHLDTLKEEEKPSPNEKDSDDDGDDDDDGQSSSNGFFKLGTANGLKTATVNVTSMTDGKVLVPSKVVELSRGHLSKINTISNSSLDKDPLPLKISSVFSGEGVALMTNGLPIAHDSDESNDHPQISNVESLGPNSMTDFDEMMGDNSNDFDSEMLLEPKTEPIDISDDEEFNFKDDDLTDAVAKDPSLISHLPKGYIYCTTNIQLGKVNIEWISPDRVKLYLDQPVEIVYDDFVQILGPNRQRNLTAVSRYMQNHIRERFLGIYPVHLRLDWIFIESAKLQQEVITLCDFNKLDPLSIVFKDKIVCLSSNYRDDSKMPIKDVYVLDIYQLASQLFPHEDVKTMNISEILRKSRQIDAELIEKQEQLEKTVATYKRNILVCKSRIMKMKQTQNQNGEV